MCMFSGMFYQFVCVCVHHSHTMNNKPAICVRMSKNGWAGDLSCLTCDCHGHVNVTEAVKHQDQSLPGIPLQTEN